MAIGKVKITVKAYEFEYETEKDNFLDEATESIDFGDFELEKAEIVGEVELDEEEPEEEETTP